MKEDKMKSNSVILAVGQENVVNFCVPRDLS